MPRPRERDEALLVALLFDVNQARAEVRAGRSVTTSSSNRHDQQHRRGRLAEAMEAYADAAATSGVPLPYRYRDEMRLNRSMAGKARDTLLPK